MRTGTITRLLAAATGLVLAVGGAALPAQADDQTAVVDVAVYDDYSGDPMAAEYDVYGSDPEIGSPTPIASGVVPGNSSADVPAGDRWVTVRAGGYVSQTRFVQLEGDTAQSLTFYLTQPQGTLTGSVLRQGGATYTCAWVRAYPIGQDDEEQTWRGSASSESNGQWEMNLPAGSYKVLIADECAARPSVWVGGTDYSTATSFTVTADTATTVPATTLFNASVITGKVVDSANRPIQGISVVAYSSSDEEDFYDSKSTSASGVFLFDELAAGTYRLKFVDPSGDYATEYYQDKTTLASATPVSATVGGTTTLAAPVKVADSVVTRPAPALVGKVTSMAKVGLRGVRVTAYKPGITEKSEWDYVASTTSLKGGVWRFEHLSSETGDVLPPGVYKLRFSAYDGDFATHEAEWFNNRFSARAAQTIKVGATGTVTAATTDLIGYSGLAGKLTLPTGETSSDIEGWVQIRDADGVYVASTSTDSNGAWRATSLLPGVYTVSFHGQRYMRSDGHMVPYIRQFWKNRYSQSTAQTISLTDSKTATGINAALGRTLLAWSAPKVTGKARKGRTLSANRGAWNTEVSTSYRYQWLRSGRAIAKATGRTYKLKSSDVGKKISVKITAVDRRGELATGTAVSRTTSKVKKR